MAHRGRLNVLAHVLGKPYARILAEFEGREPARRGAPLRGHRRRLGRRRQVPRRRAARGQQSTAPTSATAPTAQRSPWSWRPTPATSSSSTRSSRAWPAPPTRIAIASGPPLQDEASSLGVLIHGDAAFPGQGVVAETLNLSRLPGYRTGGTLHIIANNQLGFTTEPGEGRSTLYASDLAKGFEIPIVHVNADDPDACLAAIRLAVAYRARVRQGLSDRPDRLPALGPQRRRRPVVHPAAHLRRDRQAADRARAVRRATWCRRGVVREGDPEAFLKAGLDEFQRIRESVRRQSDAADRPCRRPDRAAPSPSRRSRQRASCSRSTWQRSRRSTTRC